MIATAGAVKIVYNDNMIFLHPTEIMWWFLLVAQAFSAAVVITAPQRYKGETGYAKSSWGPRMCLFLHAIQSIDHNFNMALNTSYPIIVIVSKDHEFDHDDGPYTSSDRRRIRKWAPHSQIIFVDVDFYTGYAFPPGVFVPQVNRWIKGLDGGTPGRTIGYRSMCRLWSGRIQVHPVIAAFDYYMRLDDDGFFTRPLRVDPIAKLHSKGGDYGYIRKSDDPHGYLALKNLVHPKKLSGTNSPYTNFHIARPVTFRSSEYKRLWSRAQDNQIFMKHRVGDALWHQMLIDIGVFKAPVRMRWVPYAHNTNDYPGYPQNTGNMSVL